MHVMMIMTMMMQANIDPAQAPAEWPLDNLAAKMQQYCPLLRDMTAAELAGAAGGSYEGLRMHLRKRAVDAYWDKVRV